MQDTLNDLELGVSTLIAWNEEHFKGWLDIRKPSIYDAPLGLNIGFGKRVEGGYYHAFSDSYLRHEILLEKLPEYLRVLQPWAAEVQADISKRGIE